MVEINKVISYTTLLNQIFDDKKQKWQRKRSQ